MCWWMADDDDDNGDDKDEDVKDYDDVGDDADRDDDDEGDDIVLIKIMPVPSTHKKNPDHLYSLINHQRTTVKPYKF